MRIISRILIYFLLISGSFIFLVPLFWMLSTALKPIDQTMSMPPTWIPVRLFLEKDQVRREVSKIETIEVPSVMFTVDETGEKLVMPQSRMQDGKMMGRNKDGEEALIPVTILKEIPASREQPWFKVVPTVDKAGH
ncbi:MAG: hypothetical protein V2A34_04380, partial [Lentisphaerota bacterium]